ncbi:MAG: GNAT family N-acetyltransferase [Candidatus Fimenecus sp.]
MLDFIIREAVISDSFDIYNINKSSLGYDYEFERQKKKIEAVLNDRSQVIFVACTKEKVIGYIHLVNYDVIYADNYKNVMGLAVDCDFKRHGVGTALMKSAEKWAQDNGACGIRLCSGIERESAHEFYLSQGYDCNKLQKNFKKEF